MAVERPSRYDAVHVLLLSWEDGDSRMHDQLLDLKHVFKRFYNYDVMEWQIPSHQPYSTLNRYLLDYRDLYDGPRKLLILYYAGHGSMNKDRDPLWMCFDDSESPQFEWSGLQNLFLDETTSDVVFIIDCCKAGSSIRFVKPRKHGIVQLLAACGFENSTRLDGEHTFTANLVIELKEIAQKGAKLSSIHTNLNNRLKRWLPIATQEQCVSAGLYLLADSEEDRVIYFRSLAKARLPQVAAKDTHQANGSSNSVNFIEYIEQRGPALGDPGAVSTKDSTSYSDAPATTASSLSHYSTEPAEEAVSVSNGSSTQTNGSSLNGGNTVVRSDCARRLEDSPSSELMQSRDPDSDTAVVLESDSSGSCAVQSNPPKEPATTSYGIDDRLAHFVSSLYFPEMKLRSETIALAHEETFTWALAEDSSFMNWLSSDERIFWVSGKPGSGKSTLMKFIHRSQRVQQQLSHKRSVEIFLSYFFFWRSGNAMQRSYLGFLRALLYQMVKESREATHTLALWLTHRSETDFLSLTERQNGRIPLWNPTVKDMLENAILHLLEHNESQPKPSVRFILVDAMDECDGSDWVREELIRFVLVIAQFSSVKLCVSSRPWNSFKLAFDRFPKLLMQDFTYSDIYKYASTRLEEALGGYVQVYSEGLSRSLATAVALKSDGVFFWVRLVIENLIQGIDDVYTVEQMWEIFDELPTDLENLYFDLLKKVRVSRAAEVFSIVRTCQWPVIEAGSAVIFQPILTARGLYYALSATTESVLSAGIVPTTPVEARGISALISKRLEADTAGLVIIGYLHTSVPSLEQQEDIVSYTHQTVNDFLATPDAKSWLQPALSNFNPHLALLRSFVLQLKTLDMGVTVDAGLDELQELKCWSLVEAAVRYANQAYSATGESSAGRDEATLLLDELDSTMAVQLNRWSSGSIQGHWSQFLPLGRPRSHEWEDSFLSFAMSWNLYQYIEATCNDQNCFNKPGRPLLNYALSPLPGSTSFAANTEAVLILLNGGADPNEVFGGETVWRRFLQTYYKFEAYKGDSDNSYFLRRIYNQFLHHGADRKIAYKMAFAGERARVPLPALQPE